MGFLFCFGQVLPFWFEKRAAQFCLKLERFWVAVKELNLSYQNPKTILFYYISLNIMEI